MNSRAMAGNTTLARVNPSPRQAQNSVKTLLLYFPYFIFYRA